jgi:hypothetical protein
VYRNFSNPWVKFVEKFVFKTHLSVPRLLPFKTCVLIIPYGLYNILEISKLFQRILGPFQNVQERFCEKNQEIVNQNSIYKKFSILFFTKILILNKKFIHSITK